MPDRTALLRERRTNHVQEGLLQTGLYHSFELPDGKRLHGAMPIEWELERLAAFGLPEDLRGRKALDIGPWDGFYTFALEQRGAELTAIDYVEGALSADGRL